MRRPTLPTGTETGPAYSLEQKLCRPVISLNLQVLAVSIWRGSDRSSQPPIRSRALFGERVRVTAGITLLGRINDHGRGICDSAARRVALGVHVAVVGGSKAWQFARLLELCKPAGDLLLGRDSGTGGEHHASAASK
jgi:hypothetical protein